MEHKEEEGSIILVWYVGSRFCECGGGEMALADNCVHGGFCCNSVENVDITTGELRELFITGSVIVHSLHIVYEGNAFSRVHVCLSIHLSIYVILWLVYCAVVYLTLRCSELDTVVGRHMDYTI